MAVERAIAIDRSRLCSFRYKLYYYFIYLLVDSSPSILSFLMAVLCKDDGGDMESVSEYKYGF